MPHLKLVSTKCYLKIVNVLYKNFEGIFNFKFQTLYKNIGDIKCKSICMNVICISKFASFNLTLFQFIF